jgi:AbrB family looped-hinge helix DNA binding protein
MAFDIGFKPEEDPIVSTTVTLDKARRVVIPKAMREQLRMDAGDEFELSVEGEILTLRPSRPAARLRKKQGLWVFGGAAPISAAETNAVLQEIRELRDRRNRGDDR